MLGNDVAESIIVDAAGNAWVGGSDFRPDLSPIPGQYFRTIRRFMPDGTLCWTATSEGGGLCNASTRDLALDPSGNLLVAGNATCFEYAHGTVMKYPAAGCCGPITPTFPPAAPGTLTAIGQPGSIWLSWSPATPGTNPISAYEIWRATCPACTASLLASIPAPGTAFVDAGVTPGASYTYTVRAIDTAGLLGPASPLATAIPTFGGNPQLTLSLALTPPSLLECQDFQLMMTLSNTGDVPVDWDELPGIVNVWTGGMLVRQVEYSNLPEVPLTLPLNPGDGGVIGWSQFKPVGTGFVTFTVSKSGWCPSASVWVEAVASISATIMSGPSLPPPSVSVVMTVSPSNPLPGSPVTYRIAVTNTGTSPLEDLSITDTVPAEITGLSTAQPFSIMGFPGHAAFAWLPSQTPLGDGRTVVSWFRVGALSPINPGMTFTFTITGTAGSPSATTIVSNLLQVDASTSLTCPSSFGTTPVSFTLAGSSQPSAGLSIVKTLAPAAPVIGAPVTYTLTVVNTGTDTVTSLTLADTISAVITGVTTSQPPPFGPPTVTTVTAGTSFVWYKSLPPGSFLLPGDAFTFTITGTVGPVGVTTVVSNTAYADAKCPTGLTAAASNVVCFTVTADGGPAVLSLFATKTVSSTALMSGQAGLYSITVLNTGTDTITGLTVVDTVAPIFVTGSATQPKGFSAPTVISVAGSGTRYEWNQAGLMLAPGALLTFGIPFAAGVVGSPILGTNRADVYASGTSGNAMTQTGVVTCLVSPCAVCVTVPVLGCGFVVSNPTPKIGDFVTCTARIRNTGTGPCNAGSVTLSLSDPSLCALISAPVTSGWSLVPGEEIVLVWTYRYTGNGQLTFSVTAVAIDPVTGLPVHAPPATATCDSPAPTTQPLVIVGGPQGWINPYLGHVAVIHFYVPRPGWVSINIYSYRRRPVHRVQIHANRRGWHSVRWGGTNEHRQVVAPGPYHVVVHGPGLKAHGSLAVKH